MKRALLVGLLILFFALPLFAQVDTAWVRRYDGLGKGDDGASAVAIDGSGNIYVTGVSVGGETSFDCATIKYYPNGDTAWVRRYNGPENAEDGASAIAVDGSGNAHVTGHSWNSGTEGDYVTIKYYPNGDTAWVRRYNGPGNYWDFARAIVADASGNVYVTGRSCGSGTGYDYATIKYYPNGDTAWVRRYDGGEWDDAHAMTINGSGNIYVTGGSYRSGTDFDYATIKYDSSGNELWLQRYNGPENDVDHASDIAVDNSGNIYVTGYSWVSTSNGDYATIKYYPDGHTSWVRRYNGPANDQDVASAVAVDGSHNVYVTGYSFGAGLGPDYVTIKYYPNGDTAWVRRYNGPANDHDVASVLAIDGSGSVYVTGGSYGSGTEYDYATIKYYPNGDTAWVVRYNGPGNGEDVASGIALDRSGNVYVTGRSDGSGTFNDYATLKYYQHNDPPDPFSLIFPPSKASTLRKLRFDWESATDPNPFDQVRYDLYISTSYHSFLDSATIDSNLVASEHTKTLDYGTYYWKVIAKDNFGAQRESNEIRNFMVTGIHASLGNFNGDGSIDVADVVFLINYLYTSGPAPDPSELGDVNCDEGVNIADVVFLINYLFKNGPAPSC